MIWKQEFCTATCKSHDVYGLKWKYLYDILVRDDSNLQNEVKSYNLMQERSTEAMFAHVCVSQEGYTELGTPVASGPLKGEGYFTVPFVPFNL